MGERARTGMAAVLFADLVGSTELRSRIGDAAADQLSARVEAVLRQAVETCGGRVVKGLGDGVMATFEAATPALDAAAELNRAVHRLGRGPDVSEPVELRVGIGAGDVTWTGDPDASADCFGTPVVEAARLCAAAEPGQVLCTAVVGVLAQRGSHELVPAGAFTLKGLPDPVDALALRWSPDSGPVVPLPPVASAPSAFTFVGRAAELDALTDAWKATLEGQLRLVLLAGEPGAGKTRLAAELARRAHDDGALVLGGRCDEDLEAPYQPFVEALRHHAAHVPDAGLAQELGPGGVELARLAPELAQRLPGPAREAGDPATEQARLLEAVAGWLAAAAANRPVLVILDDVHWADRPTLVLLRHVLRSAPASPVLLVGTYRDTDIDRRHPFGELLADLRRDHNVSRLAVGGLAPEGVRDFVAAAAGHELDATGAALAEAVHASTDGNPFFVGELLRHLAETGAIFQRDGRWTSDRAVEELGIPEGVRDVVGRRLSRLSEDADTILHQAAVLGLTFEVRVVGGMVDLPPDGVLDALDSAAAAGLVVEAAADGQAAYQFTHAIVREVLYEELSLPRKQRAHKRAADAILAAAGSDPSRSATALALHLQLAGAAADPATTVRWSMVAAREAAAMFAFDQAATHVRTALEIMQDHDFPPGELAFAHEQLGMLSFVSGTDLEEGARAYERAIDLYRRAGDRRREGLVHSKLGGQLSTFGGLMTTNIAQALQHLELADQLMREESGDGPGVARAYLELGLATTATRAGDTERGDRASARALELARSVGQHRLLAIATTVRSWLLWERGVHEASTRLAEEGWELSDRIDDPTSAFLASWMYGNQAWFAEGPREATRRFRRDVDRGRLDRAPGQRLILSSLINFCLFQAGDHEEALRYETQWPIRSLWLDGDWEAHGDHWIVEVPNIASETGDLWSAATMAEITVRSLAMAGRHDDVRLMADPLLDELLAQSPSTTALRLLQARAMSEAARGDLEAVRRDRDRLAGLWSVPDSWPLIAGREMVLDGMVAGLEGASPDVVDDSFGAAVATFRSVHSVWEELPALAWWGQALARIGMPQAARERAAEVAARQQQLGIHPRWASWAASLAG